MALLGYGICFDVSRYLAVEGVISRRTLGNDSKIIGAQLDRKSTRLNSSHDQISYAVFCLKKKTIRQREPKYANDEREDEGDSDRGAIRRTLPRRGSENQRSGEREQGGAEQNEGANSNHSA